MSRFSQLEFDKGDAERLPPETAPRPVRDEKHYLALADEKQRRGEFEEALRYFSRALEYDPNLQAGWLGQARMLLALGEYKEARLWSEKALEVQKDDPELLSARAVAIARLGEPDRAMALSDGAMQQKGQTPFIWLARGEVLLSMARSNDGYCFQQAVSASKGDWFTHTEIAHVYLIYRIPEKAIGAAQDAIRTSAKEPWAWHTLGMCQHAIHRDGDARRSFQRAKSIAPGYEPSDRALSDLAGVSPLDSLWRWFRGLFSRGNET